MKGVLTAEEIARLREKPSTGNKVRSAGHFESKVGTKYRSRKGRTWTRANGYAYFCPSDEDWNRANLGKH